MLTQTFTLPLPLHPNYNPHVGRGQIRAESTVSTLRRDPNPNPNPIYSNDLPLIRTTDDLSTLNPI